MSSDMNRVSKREVRQKLTFSRQGLTKDDVTNGEIGRPQGMANTVSSAPQSRFTTITVHPAFRQTHPPSSLRAHPPATRTPPLASQRRPRPVHHHLPSLSWSAVVHRHRTMTTTVRRYRRYLPQRPFSIHHPKRNHVPVHYPHQHVSIGQTTPPPHSLFYLVTRHRATFRAFAHQLQDPFRPFNVVTKNPKNNFSDRSKIIIRLQFSTKIIFTLVPFPRTLHQLPSYENQVSLRRHQP